ncbi:MAG: DedA family protein [Solirubrobacteraceae bacterium]|nr:DedA family protein [Solirubrobacteraceae bacterium]
MSSWIDEAVRNGGYPALGGLILIENLFPPIPSEVILPLAGFYVERGELTFILAVLVATLGSLIGALILYGGARRGGRPVIYAHAHRVRIRHSELDRADAWFDRYGPWLVLFGRVVPGVRSLVSIPAGLSEMPIWQFVALTTLGSAVWNSALIGAGWALGSNFEAVGDVIGPLSKPLLAVAILAMIGGFIMLRRRAKVDTPVAPATTPEG